MGYKPESEKPEPPQFTLGFVIFTIIVLITLSTVVAMLSMPYGLELVIYFYVFWNIRKFYFGSWQTIQTAALISLNNCQRSGPGSTRSARSRTKPATQ